MRTLEICRVTHGPQPLGSFCLQIHCLCLSMAHPHPFRIVVTRRRSKPATFGLRNTKTDPPLQLMRPRTPSVCVNTHHEIATMAFERYVDGSKRMVVNGNRCGFSGNWPLSRPYQPTTAEPAAHARSPKSASVYDPALYRILRQLNGDNGLVLDDLEPESILFSDRELKRSQQLGVAANAVKSVGLRYKISRSPPLPQLLDNEP